MQVLPAGLESRPSLGKLLEESLLVLEEALLAFEAIVPVVGMSRLKGLVDHVADFDIGLSLAGRQDGALLLLARKLFFLDCLDRLLGFTIVTLV